jgi:hypothetical protein
MNDPGIIRIYYLKKSQASLPVYFFPGTVIDISGYFSGDLSELDFEPGTVNITQETVETTAGKHTNTNVTFVVSGITPAIHEILSALANEPHIFILEDIEGQFQLCGTNSYRAKFNYKLNHNTPPQSVKSYTASIDWISMQGLIFCTIE